jgi:predicted ATPase
MPSLSSSLLGKACLRRGLLKRTRMKPEGVTAPGRKVTRVDGSPFGVREVRLRGFRSARSVGFAPGPVCALVGGPSVGKSNVLEAVFMLLQQDPKPGAHDVTRGDVDTMHLAATLADGDEITLKANPPGTSARTGPSLPALFLPATERSGALVAPGSNGRAAEVAQQYFARPAVPSAAARASTLVAALEALCDAGETGLVLLVEEPELFLRPQAQRHLYRLLRTFAETGNQALYSTHAPAFLNVGRLEEVALVEWSTRAGTTIVHPEPLDADESFRALSEIDAERSELFLARAVLLVEGRTEKLTFPLIFRALGRDADRDGISIVECGGKPNMPLFVRVCKAAKVPYVVVHDRDAAPGRKPILAERVLNAQIAELAGAERTVVLAPDFEAIAGLRGRGHKPARAWQHFSSMTAEHVPSSLREAVERVLALADH